jgi:methylglutaconyl-CoA hydratase
MEPHMPTYEYLQLTEHDSVQTVTLNRPELRNAFNSGLVAELREHFSSLSSTTARPRAVRLRGAGKAFCAGADLGYMREMASYSADENYADALALAEMLAAVNNCPVPVVAQVQRAAFGGALGLIACCDKAVATDDAIFAFSEVRLGISPATIAPYVIAKIGFSQARNLFLSGERFDAARALHCGLVHRVVAVGELEAATSEELAALKLAGPTAASATKALINRMATVSPEIRDETARLIAELRVSAEGQAGLSAFLNKAKPPWQE